MQGEHTHGPREDWDGAQKALVWRAVSLAIVKSVAEAAQIVRVLALVMSSGTYAQREMCKHERDTHITEEVNSAPVNLVPKFAPMTLSGASVCSLRTLTSSRFHVVLAGAYSISAVDSLPEFSRVANVLLTLSGLRVSTF